MRSQSTNLEFCTQTANKKNPIRTSVDRIP